MIGILKPTAHESSKSTKILLKSLHCTGCQAMKDGCSRASTLTYPWETDFLLMIYLGMANLDTAIPTQIKKGCTACPLISINKLNVKSEVNEILAAFSNVAVWAILDDHIRDHNNFKAKLLIKLLNPHLEHSLALLGIEKNKIPDPRLLATADLNRPNNLKEYLEHMQPYVSGIWLKAIQKLLPDINISVIGRIATDLCSIQLLQDMLSDRESDLATGNFNPLVNEQITTEAKGYLASASQRFVYTADKFREPWRTFCKDTILNHISPLINTNIKQDSIKHNITEGIHVAGTSS